MTARVLPFRRLAPAPDPVPVRVEVDGETVVAEALAPGETLLVWVVAREDDAVELHALRGEAPPPTPPRRE